MPKTFWQAMIFVPIFFAYCLFISLRDWLTPWEPKPRQIYVLIGCGGILAIVYVENNAIVSYESTSFEPECWEI